MSLSIIKTVRSHPRLPYEAMQKDVLGASYALTLGFIGEKRAQRLNREYRKKTYVPNVLSFPLSSNVGEIYIAPSVAAREAKRFGMTVNGYIGFLFIHGLLHLKGHDHGATMEKAEKRYVSKYHLR